MKNTITALALLISISTQAQISNTEFYEDIKRFNEIAEVDRSNEGEDYDSESCNIIMQVVRNKDGYDVYLKYGNPTRKEEPPIHYTMLDGWEQKVKDGHLWLTGHLMLADNPNAPLRTFGLGYDFEGNLIMAIIESNKVNGAWILTNSADFDD